MGDERRRRPGFALVLAALAALSALSCGRPASSRLVYPVRGQVLFGGKPLAGVIVVFHPAGEWVAETNFPFAQTDADGRFTVSTYGAADGAPTGEYRIAVRDGRSGEEDTRSDVKGTPRRTRTVSLPNRYGDPATSGLRATIAAEPNDLEPFRLTTRPGDSTKPQPLPVDD